MHAMGLTRITSVSTCTAALAPMRWALEMTCSSRLAFSSGSIRNTQDTKERSSPTDPASSISSTLHWLSSCRAALPFMYLFSVPCLIGAMMT